MKIKDAFKRLHFTISNGNKPNETDAEAFNDICEVFKQQEEKTVQDNLLFAKLYTLTLEKLTGTYNDVDFANKRLNDILSEPMNLRIECLTSVLKVVEVTQVFADPILSEKSGEELKVVFERYPKFQADFATCYEWWSKENVTAHLNTNINLSIQKFKNYV